MLVKGEYEYQHSNRNNTRIRGMLFDGLLDHSILHVREGV